MEPSGQWPESDDSPHPKVIDFLSVSIAILTLTLPVYTISLYSSEALQLSPTVASPNLTSPGLMSQTDQSGSGTVNGAALSELGQGEL